MGVNLPIQNYFTRIVETGPWIRPSDWPVITDVPDEVQFLMSDINDASCTIRTQFTDPSGTQNIVIDWGDGTTNTVGTSSTTNTSHQYTPGTGTPCSRGYTTFKIRIYFTETGVSVLSSCRLLSKMDFTNTLQPYVNVGLLEAYYGDNTQTVAITQYFYSNNLNSGSNYSYLEYVKLPATVSWTLFSSSFDGCNALAVLVMPTSAPNLSSIGTFVNNCYSLRSITFPSNATRINSFGSAFLNCYNLTSVTFPETLNSCTTFTTCFQNCYSLKNVTVPSINTCTNLSTMFNGCNSLEWVKFTSLPTTSATCNMSTMFTSCTNLQTVYFPATCTSTVNYTCTSMFSSLVSLKTITFPSGFNPNTLSGAFGSSGVRSVTFQSGASNLTVMTNLFQNCTFLISAILPATVSASGVNLSQAFSSCLSIKTITIPNTYLVTNLQTTFGSCISLQTINWTPGAQNSLTTMLNTFGLCMSLTSVTLPTSMNSLTTLSGSFSSCRSLTTITLPTSLNAVTTVNSMCLSSFNLTSVTLPTSMSACRDFSVMFSGCNSIKTITLPETVSSATTTFLNTFTGCVSLKTLTLPSVNQLSLVTSFANAIQYCNNLTTVNNLNKIGSLTATPLMSADFNVLNSATSLSFSAPMSKLILNGINSSGKIKLNSLRLLNASAGQWTGTLPSISVAYTDMSTVNLIQLFNDIAAQGTVVSKQIDITGSTGTAGLTTTNRQIITTKGWFIVG